MDTFRGELIGPIFLLGVDVVEKMVKLHSHVKHAGKAGRAEASVGDEGVDRVRIHIESVSVVLHHQRENGHQGRITAGDLRPAPARVHCRPR